MEVRSENETRNTRKMKIMNRRDEVEKKEKAL